jgi:hypothetical protein
MAFVVLEFVALETKRSIQGGLLALRYDTSAVFI